MKPILLPANQSAHFYRGGAAIAEFRGTDAATTGPEDWIASTTTRFGTDIGLSVLPDGEVLRDAIERDPIGYLGSDHFARFGTDQALLVKLLDAGERLPVHVHPSQEFAASHLNCAHGKTEAWIIIGTSGADPVVYVGFRESATPETVAAWVNGQQTEVMLAALNRIAVAPGDTVLVPAGTPHAVGAGVFLIELQEPTDFSVMLEWQGFDLPARGDEQLGLPTSVILGCLDPSGWDARRLASCVTHHAMLKQAGTRRLLPPAADPFFRADHIVVDGASTLPARYSVVVVTAGAARLDWSDGSLDVKRGHTVLIPHGAGDVRVTGTAELVRCSPPPVGVPDKA